MSMKNLKRISASFFLCMILFSGISAEESSLFIRRDTAKDLLQGGNYCTPLAKTQKEEELFLIEEATERGDAQSQEYLGKLYYKGEKEDLEKSFYYTQKAAEQGLSVSQERLGSLYYFGKGTQRDIKKAEEWWKKAAKQGNTEAQLALGNFYYQRDKDGLIKNPHKAIKWWEKAAKQGDEKASFYLEQHSRSILESDKYIFRKLFILQNKEKARALFRTSLTRKQEFMKPSFWKQASS